MRKAPPKALEDAVDGPYYLRANPDVAAAGMAPWRHFWEFGMAEGRPGWSAEASKAMLRRHGQDPDIGAAMDYPPPPAGQARRAALYAASTAGPATRALLARWATALAAEGWTAHTFDERSFPPGPGLCPVVFAPHEFFYHAPGRPRTGIADAGPYVAVNTAPLGDPSFPLALPFLVQAAALADVDPQNAAALNTLGLAARFLPPPLAWDAPAELPEWPRTVYVPEAVKAYAGGPYVQRPYALIGFGARTERRGRLLAALAPALSAYPSFLSFPTLFALQALPSKAGPDPRLLRALCGRSKIYLHLHSAPDAPFAWDKIADAALSQETLALVEPGFRAPGLVPGAHYLEAEVGAWPAVLERLLGGPAGFHECLRLRQAAVTLLRERYDAGRMMASLAGLWGAAHGD